MASSTSPSRNFDRCEKIGVGKAHDEPIKKCTSHEQLLHHVVSRLEIDANEQTQIVEAQSNEEMWPPGNCDWITGNAEITTWLEEQPESAYLRLQGAPGCGKSVIAANLVNRLQTDEKAIVRHFCTGTIPSSKKYESVLKSFVLQLLQRSDELTAYVYQQYGSGKLQISTDFFTKLLRTFITLDLDPSLSPLYIWFIVDAIDECEEQVQLINLMNAISSIPAAPQQAVCKVLLTTRLLREDIMARFIGSQPIILSEKDGLLDLAIRAYVSWKMDVRLGQLGLESGEIETSKIKISTKANGKSAHNSARTSLTIY